MSNAEKKWVFLPSAKGWIREHDPETESGLVPQKTETKGDSDE